MDFGNPRRPRKKDSGSCPTNSRDVHCQDDSIHMAKHGVESTKSAHAAKDQVSESNLGSSREVSQPPARLRVLVADDHPVVREGLTAVINRQQDMHVIAQSANGREAVDTFVAECPDVGLIDLRMPGMDGIEAVIQICMKMDSPHLVILTTYPKEEDIYRALQAGAQGYLLKSASTGELVECIRTVANGNSWVPPTVGAKLANRVANRELTMREREVLRLMAGGKSNKEIGVVLNISEGTVKVHMTHILEKLKAGGRTEAIALAVKKGLVILDPLSAA
jgi:DNA-binding NarL/FixJ family response regulator